MYVCVSVYVRACAHGVQKSVLNSLELELQIVLSPHNVGVKNWTWVH